MKETTLLYLTNEHGETLMLYRNKKKNDPNQGKWIGIGGHLEPGETPWDCIKREAKEETGLEIISPKYRGVVNFFSNVAEDEVMHLFTANNFQGTLRSCEEGTLKWLTKEEFNRLPQWEGDKLFLKELETNPTFFTMSLRYEGDNLVKAFLNDNRIV